MSQEWRFSRALTGIIAGFIVLSIFELIVALDHFKPALFVDGLHNLLVEGLLLGLNLIEQRRKHRGLVESRVPVWTAMGVLLIGLPAGLVGWTTEASQAHTGAALLLSVLSLGLCLVGAQIIHGCGLEADHNAESVIIHLAIDALVAGNASMVYLLELAGASSKLDPLSTITSTAVATGLSLRFIIRHRSGHLHMRPGSH